MNLTCSYCQTPFTLGMAQKIAALQKMYTESLHHYDAHCPRCGRANAVSRERLEMFTPGWREAINVAAPESTPPASAPAPAMTPAKPEAKKAAAKMPAKKTANQAAPKAKKAVQKTAANKKTKRK
jgi:hypothetical protein